MLLDKPYKLYKNRPKLGSYRPRLTLKQKIVLNYIKDFTKAFKMSPTLSEMAYDLSSTKQNIQCHLNPLIKKGYIRKKKYKMRGITLL